ncbi:MAG: phosphate signaling complex protein PhoU [Chloroflexota bacterium]|nr:MAG: phosphate signaling complex protein PhoU [Chloroflexota bacterium]
MASISPRETLDRAIDELLAEVIVQGDMVKDALFNAVNALKDQNISKAKVIYDGDRQINQKHFEIEEEVITLIATQQPMARDLRLLAAILEVTTELERMGDYAKGIARITVRIGEEDLLKPVESIPAMAMVCIDMLDRALKAFVERDADAARSIPDEDDQVDNFYNQIYRALMDHMISNPSNIDRANHLLWVAHNLERVADRVTNVCERIVFVVTGEILEMDRTDDEWFADEPW